WANWNDYVAIRPLNNPLDLRISVKMEHAGNSRYGGMMMISYYDNGQYNTGHFYVGTGTTPNSSSLPSHLRNKAYSEYNRWFSWNGKQVFHAFFQDSYGAIMLIIDDTLNLGDGFGTQEVSGEIWYKNFNTS